jgi:phosphoribosylaminoimidazole-succinocarboxamide synthase
MRRARLSRRQRLEFLPERPARSADSGCPPACARPTACQDAIFTPTTKAPKGQHDEPIDDARAPPRRPALYEQVKSVSLALYRFGHDRAARAGMILADTKFEFGTDAAGRLYPDRRDPHARLLALLAEGKLRRQPVAAELRQAVRARLPPGLKWDQKPPAPRLPADVIARTQEKYLAALKNLLG